MTKQGKIKLYGMAILLAGMLGCTTKSQKANEAKETSVVQSPQTVPADSMEEREETEEWPMVADIPEDTNATASEAEEEDEEMDEFMANGGLNGIRFEGWTNKEFLNNEYLHTLRKYIDAYLDGEIEEPNLDPYRDRIKCPFAVYGTMPYTGGGLLATIIFIDMPEKMFDAWIYSSVDVEKRTVSGYQVQTIRVSEEEGTLAKEEILRIIKENPINKLW